MTRGRTRCDRRAINGLDTIKNVLVLDDSIWHGNSLREAREGVTGSRALQGLGLTVHYAAVYARTEACVAEDFHFEVCPTPRVFQWNIFSHPQVTLTSCYDIDGVICRAPTQEECDDGARYRAFLNSAPARLPATYPVGAFVSARPEKYRQETESWLSVHGFKSGAVELLDEEGATTPRQATCHARFKAERYRRRLETLFFESSPEQAFEIAKLSGKDVFCTQTMQYVDGANPQEDPKLKISELRRTISKLKIKIEGQDHKIGELRASREHNLRELRQCRNRLSEIEKTLKELER